MPLNFSVTGAALPVSIRYVVPLCSNVVFPADSMTVGTTPILVSPFKSWLNVVSSPSSVALVPATGPTSVAV